MSMCPFSFLLSVLFLNFIIIFLAIKITIFYSLPLEGGRFTSVNEHGILSQVIVESLSDLCSYWYLLDKFIFHLN